MLPRSNSSQVLPFLTFPADVAREAREAQGINASEMKDLLTPLAAVVDEEGNVFGEVLDGG